MARGFVLVTVAVALCAFTARAQSFGDCTEQVISAPTESKARLRGEMKDFAAIGMFTIIGLLLVYVSIRTLAIWG